MLRPTPGDPWGVEQHHWNTGAKENEQLDPGGPSNRRKSSGPNLLWKKYEPDNEEEKVAKWSVLKAKLTE